MKLFLLVAFCGFLQICFGASIGSKNETSSEINGDLKAKELFLQTIEKLVHNVTDDNIIEGSAMMWAIVTNQDTSKLNETFFQRFNEINNSTAEEFRNISSKDVKKANETNKVLLKEFGTDKANSTVLMRGLESNATSGEIKAGEVEFSVNLLHKTFGQSKKEACHNLYADDADYADHFELCQKYE